ncbi:hypothetical protein ACWCOP_02090 [Maricaulaceae bacterium MS644]
MTRILARILAFILAVTFLGVALVVIVNLRPQGVGGYVLIAVLLALAFFLPVAIYRAMMGKWARDHRPDETRVGAGLAMGTAIDPARRRRDEDTGGDDADLIG